MPDITSPAWWISAVLMGLALNVASAYVKNWIDRSFSSSMRWWRQISKKRRDAFEQQVASIMQDQDYEHYTLLVATHSTASLHFLGLAIFILALVVAITGAMSSETTAWLGPYLRIAAAVTSYLLLFISFAEYQFLQRHQDARREARRRLRLNSESGS